jgi:hypothetical protein
LLYYRARAFELPQAPAPAGARAPAAREPDAGVVLRWKFHKGRPFYQELTTETDMTLTFPNRDVRQKGTQTFFFRWTPQEQDEDRNWVLTQQVEGVRMEIDAGGNKMKYDSTKGDNDSGTLSDFYRLLVGGEFQVTLDPRKLKVTRIGGREELIKRIVNGNPQKKSLADHVLSEKALVEMAETSFAALPEEPVEPGDSWTRKGKLPMSSVGEYTVTYRYTYEGREGRLDRVKVECTLKELPAGGDGKAPPMRIKKGATSGKGSGTLFFDRDKGQVARLELSLRVEGSYTTRANDVDTEVGVVQTQRTTLRTTDANPLKQARAPEDDSTELQRLREENRRLRQKLKAIEEALQREGRPGD